MTDDIVTRLRDEAQTFWDVRRFRPLWTEAADEIERLRTELAYWKALPFCPRCGQCQDNEQVLNNE